MPVKSEQGAQVCQLRAHFNVSHRQMDKGGKSEEEIWLTLDLARPCLLVEALGVTLLDNVEGRIDEDFDERETGLLVQLARDGAVGAVWRDERGEGHAGSAREELRDLLR